MKLLLNFNVNRARDCWFLLETPCVGVGVTFMILKLGNFSLEPIIVCIA